MWLRYIVFIDRSLAIKYLHICLCMQYILSYFGEICIQLLLMQYAFMYVWFNMHLITWDAIRIYVRFIKYVCMLVSSVLFCSYASEPCKYHQLRLFTWLLFITLEFVCYIFYLMCAHILFCTIVIFCLWLCFLNLTTDLLLLKCNILPLTLVSLS